LSLFLLKAAAQEHYMLVGTYDSPKSEGIYVYKFNNQDGTARKISHVKTPNPSFVAISPDEKFVYAVHETAPQDGKGGEVAAFAFNKETGNLTILNRQLSGGDHPCHVEVDKTGRWVFVSNYSNGTLSVLPVAGDGSLGTASVIRHSGSGKHPQRQKGPHVHGAIISDDNRQLFVTDLGIDKLMIYSFDAGTGKLTPGEQPSIQAVPGAGPRLFTFHPGKKFAYVLEELSGTVVVYK
jgi:6-phosphogluconolactonase